MRPASFGEMTPEQRTFVDDVRAGPRRALDGPVQIMIASPVFGGLMQKAIAYARFAGQPNGSILTPAISELAILWAVRVWGAEYPWHVHRRSALAAGLNPSTVDAIRDGTRPPAMQEDEAAAYDFCRELLLAQSVTDPTLERARRLLGGDQGIVDLVGTLGVYQIVAMLSVVDRFPLPRGAQRQLDQPLAEDLL
jgi:4-carboxymuconolactone decarboxylase